jgi:hypothetical protein
MRTQILANGDLLITAGNAARQALADAYRRGGYQQAEGEVVEYLSSTSELALIPPENIGALTDAPILAEAEYPNDGSGPVPYDDAPVYWFPDYAIRDPWEELKNKGRVEFQRAAEG